jgi:hypothetical protein
VCHMTSSASSCESICSSQVTISERWQAWACPTK